MRKSEIKQCISYNSETSFKWTSFETSGNYGKKERDRNCCSKDRIEMKFEVIKCLSEKEFRRLTGVKKATFEKMVEILKKVNSLIASMGLRQLRRYIELLAIRFAAGLEILVYFRWRVLRAHKNRHRKSILYEIQVPNSNRSSDKMCKNI
jgi:hypothetical protein